MRRPLIALPALCAATACVTIHLHEGPGRERVPPPDAAPSADAADSAAPAPRPPSRSAEVALAVPPRAPSTAAAQALLARGLDWIASRQLEDGRWTERAEERAEERGWLADAQRPDGSWPAGLQEERGSPRPAPPESHGPQAIGVTGLCVLALAQTSVHAGAVERGRAWLYAQQDDDTGRIGTPLAHDFLYGHGIATYALLETLPEGADVAERRRLQHAVRTIHRARNPHAAWRYAVTPTGDNDTSVTGWMLAALESARERDFDVDPAALEGGLAWLDEVTDPRSGRVGYDALCSLSSRTPANESFPRERGEAMTAVGLARRAELGGARVKSAMLASHARLLKRKLPVWDPSSFGVDMYYWYHGTRGMRALGGADWEAWRAALLAAAAQGQTPDGSWDPVGPWGYSGGRAYATALMALSVGECLR